MAEAKKKKSSTVKARVTASSSTNDSKQPKAASVKTRVKTVESKDTSVKAEKKGVKKSTPAQTKVASKTLKSTQLANSTKKTKDKKEKKKKQPSYVKGAWYELRQVRWPDRSNTWQMTIAVIVFSLLLAGIVLLLDLLFQYLFNRIILQG